MRTYLTSKLRMASVATSLFPLISHLPEFLLAAAAFLLLRHYRRFPPIVNYPLFGALPNLILHPGGRIHDWLTDTLRSGGCSVILKGTAAARFDILLTCDPANVHYVFTTNFPNFPKGPDFVDLFEVLGGGIFNADGEEWRFQRRKLHGFVSSGGFRSFISETSRRKVEDALLPVLRRRAAEGEAFDLQDVFLRFTFDTTCLFVFGIDPECLSDGLPEVAFSKALDDAEAALFWRHVVPISWWKAMRWLSLGPERNLSEATKVIDGFIIDYIAKRNKNIGESGSQKSIGSDLLSCYISSGHEIVAQGNDFTKFLRDTTLNLMIAGRDTTSSALTWLFFLLSRHPTVESNILDELSSSRDPGSLVYLHAALCESLRLFPPVPFEHKAALKPDLLPTGHRVHPRRRLLFSLYAMGRMEGIWGKDCEEFRPERWISKSGKIRHEPSYKFLSFNSGPRTCLGKEIAFVQMKAAAAAVIARFQVVAAEGYIAGVPKMSIILHMKGGFMVRVSERDTPVVGW